MPSGVDATSARRGRRLVRDVTFPTKLTSSFVVLKYPPTIRPLESMAQVPLKGEKPNSRFVSVLELFVEVTPPPPRPSSPMVRPPELVLLVGRVTRISKPSKVPSLENVRKEIPCSFFPLMTQSQVRLPPFDGSSDGWLARTSFVVRSSAAAPRTPPKLRARRFTLFKLVFIFQTSFVC